MNEIKIESISEDKLKAMGVFSWPIWEKEVSRFDWHYDDAERCLFLEGSVTIETKDGKSVSFGKGDFVTFPKGLDCVWDIKKKVRKHYNFG
ncbi:MAG: cupin domain-containing protein [Candidatus Omnitrophota bacterium]